MLLGTAMLQFVMKALSVALLCLFVVLSGASAAPSKNVERVLWEHSGGYVKLGRHWQQKSGGNVYNLVETARNPVFVDLFDPVRGYAIRLYENKMLVREGKTSAGPASTWLTMRAEGKWEDGGARSKWTYPDGSFEADGEAWFEPAAHGTNMFVERSRNGEFIELHDPQRDFTIRLSAGATHIRGGKFKDFTKLYSGGWTTVPNPARIEFKIDVSDAPGRMDFAVYAKELAETWYPIISHRLNPTGTVPSRTYTIIIKQMEKKGVPAFTRNGDQHSITFSADYIEGHPKDYGMIIHELTHVVQNYNLKKSRNTFWLSEGIADYIRNYEFEPESRRDIKPETSFRKGYRTAAGFLNWIARTYDERAVEKLNISLQEDAYNEEMFNKMTGLPLDQLWTEFKKQHRPEKRQTTVADTPEPEEQ